MASTCATIAGTVDEGKAGATVLTAFRHEHSAAGALRGGLLDLQRLRLRASKTRDDDGLSVLPGSTFNTAPALRFLEAPSTFTTTPALLIDPWLCGGCLDCS
jgi:hypothetical protein